jgi:hypothetical protein
MDTQIGMGRGTFASRYIATVWRLVGGVAKAKGG